jgi:hypothetical protein
MKVTATVSASLPATDIRESLCERRWLRWKPLCIQWLRLHDIEPSAPEVEMLRMRHRAHMIACATAELPDITVFKHQLDDPRRTDTERDVVMRPLVEAAHTKLVRRNAHKIQKEIK